jgi:putative redox protein
MNINIKWAGKQNFTGENVHGQIIPISPDKNEVEMISPPDLLLMSLGSCTGLFVIPSAKAMGIELENFEIHVTGVKAETPPKLFDEINIHVKFVGAMSKKEAAAILESAHDKCFILKSLNPNIKINNFIEIESPVQ